MNAMMRPRLLSKLTLLALGVSLIPLSIVGYSSYRIGQAAVRAAVDESELQIGRQVAQHVSSELGHLLQTLRTDAQALDLTRAGSVAPTPEGIAKFLQLVYHHSDAFVAVGLFDDRARPVAEPAYLDNPQKYPSLRGHEPTHAAVVAALAQMAPVGDALAHGAAVGPVFAGAVTQVPHVVLAVAFTQTATGETRILAAEATLRDVIAHVEGLATADTEVKLLDGHTRLLGQGRASRHGGAFSAQQVPAGAEGSLPSGEAVGEYRAGGRPVIGAFVPATPYPLGVLVEKTLASALRPVNRIGTATLLWVAVSAAVGILVARLMARRLAGRVAELADGSRQIAAGNLDVALAVRSRDELGDLAASFNTMAVSLDGARREILQQKDEISSWNQTLEKRVTEKTEELRQAQDLLLRARSLTALGGLGSGVAHEINNPLAGILGLAQLLLADLPGIHPARAMVKDIEQQALRIRGIVSNLLRFAQRQAGEGFAPVDLRRTLDDAIELCGPSRLEGAGIQIARRMPTAAVVRGSAPQLQEAFMQLLQNAAKAMPHGGTLSVELDLSGAGLVRVAIKDTGRGIRSQDLERIFDPFFTTKDDWSGVGLGLSLVHKTIEEHGGTIRVESEVGRGTTFWMTFPADRGGAHLT